MGTMIERMVKFVLNDKEMPIFLCTPESLDELAVGFLRTQGMIGGMDAVAGVAMDGLSVSVTTKAPLGEAVPLPVRVESLAPVVCEFEFTMGEAMAIARRLAAVKGHYGTHCIGLITPGGDIFREDVGRHNAMDKVIGRAMMDGVDFAQCVVAATGRISLEMLVKAASVGIPIIVSKKYPSDLSVSIAERLGIVIVGHALSDAPHVFGFSAKLTK